MHETGLLDLLTGSGRPRTSHSCVVQHGAVADWWYSWPMASTLASLCLSQRRTFWTYVVTINLFSLYLMKFMLHPMLDATGKSIEIFQSYGHKCTATFFRVHSVYITFHFRLGIHFVKSVVTISSQTGQYPLWAATDRDDWRRDISAQWQPVWILSFLSCGVAVDADWLIE